MVFKKVEIRVSVDSTPPENITVSVQNAKSDQGALEKLISNRSSGTVYTTATRNRTFWFLVKKIGRRLVRFKLQFTSGGHGISC